MGAARIPVWSRLDPAVRDDGCCGLADLGAAGSASGPNWLESLCASADPERSLELAVFRLGTGRIVVS